MKYLIIILLLLIGYNAKSQTTAIPDAAFEQHLISIGLDATIDGQILTAAIDTLSVLTISNKGISDLTGIEGFIALTYLDCSYNLLTSLDITQNININFLNISGSQISSIDVSQNSALENIWFIYSPLTSLDLSSNPLVNGITGHHSDLAFLDVTNCPLLDWLNLGFDQLTSLDLSQNPLLELVALSASQLNCLNIKNGNNTIISSFYAAGNPSLTCVEVDDTTYSNLNWTNIDVQTSFSTNCSTPCTVGLDELASSTINIHPNPTTGQITISLEEVNTGSFKVLNSLGQVVLEDTFEAITKLDISLDEPSGIYFLQLEIDGQVVTKKVLKE